MILMGILTASFMDYAMPRADDLPLFQSSTFTDAPCLTNPLGAKGVGKFGDSGLNSNDRKCNIRRPLGSRCKKF
ncbi:MAG: hypothetical protein Ct9H300mP28_38030 [Pseudomonadota bacterium]|nr:MAG: hypothetical protein Ct9H300mP28_38030 [Pseudomonadota bacterium]